MYIYVHIFIYIYVYMRHHLSTRIQVLLEQKSKCFDSAGTKSSLYKSFHSTFWKTSVVQIHCLFDFSLSVP